MSKYTSAFKQQALEKVLNRAEGVKISTIAKEQGIGLSTLEYWITLSKRQVQKGDASNPFETSEGRITHDKRPEDWSYAERFAMLMECAHLNEEQMSERCRQQGLFPFHLKQWQKDFENPPQPKSRAPKNTELSELKQENRSLSKELNRKDKALAEAAALLLLQKKVAQLWAEEEEAKL